VSRHRRRRGRATQRGSGRPAAALSIPRPRKKKTNKLYLVASAVIAVLVIGGFALGGTNFQRGTQTGGSQEYVEGVGVRQDLMPTGPRGLNNHVPEGQPVAYNTVPPTSGDHWAGPANCGFYQDGLPDERIVHNLEHGNIVISYNLATQEDVARLRDAIDGIGLSAVWGVTRSYDKIPAGTVAVAAWGVLDTMDGIDEGRLKTFFDTYSGTLGPERVIC
jgi:hypothetical protein